jgi:acetylornithine aminotransferase/acetylornithine/N-succinyldiaminopimelate aminotransferase
VSGPGRPDPALEALEAAIGPVPRSTRDVMAAEDRSQVPTYSKLPVAVVRGEGSYVFDADGKRYLDLYAGHAVAILGHRHPAVVAAIQAQADRLLFYSNVVYNDVRAAAVTRLAALAPKGLGKVFLCNSGTEANETALKLARKHTGRRKVVSLTDGFHGRTLGSLGATGLGTYRDPAYPIPTEHVFVPYGDLDAAEKAIGRDAAAMILEPIPSMGGIRVAEPSYFRGLRGLCTERGAMLVFDEIQTGLGRTGRVWAGEHWGVVPDLVTSAKGIAGGVPAAAVFVREDVAAKVRLGEQGTTFGGGPLACAAIAATARVVLEGRVAEGAARVGAALRARVERVPGVRSVTGLGLMLGVNLDRPAKPVVRRLVDAGHLTGSCEADANQIRLLPPLTLTLVEAEPFVAALAGTIASEPAPHAAGRG